jgi:hypothetical protein
VQDEHGKLLRPRPAGHPPGLYLPAFQAGLVPFAFLTVSMRVNSRK